MRISDYIVPHKAKIKDSKDKVIIGVPVSKKAPSPDVAKKTFKSLGYKAQVKKGILVLVFDKADISGIRDAFDELKILGVRKFIGN